MADRPHPTYQVQSQQFATEPNGTGGYHMVATVHFVTASGDAAHIKIPLTHYTARNVHDAITTLADRMEAVRALGRGAPPPPESPA